MISAGSKYSQGTCRFPSSGRNKWIAFLILSAVNIRINLGCFMYAPLLLFVTGGRASVKEKRQE